MAINNPNILTRPIVERTGRLTASSQVVRPDDTKVEGALSNLEATRLAYTFNTAITDSSDPGTGFMALNNANKDSATVATFSVSALSGSARFDQLLDDLTTGDRIFLQELSSPNTHVLYRVTGPSTLTGNRVNIPVTREQPTTAGTGTFTNNVTVIANFFFTRTVSATGLPQPQADWLSQTSSQQISSTAVTNIAPSINDVLIWVRSALVDSTTINDPGVGLRIDDANRQSDGTFNREAGTTVLDNDVSNAYIYVAITSSDFINALDTANTFLEARRNGVLIFSSSLDDLTTPTQVSSGQFVYRRTTNLQYNYIAGDILTVVTRSTSTTTQYNYNSPVGDFTQNISDLPFSAVDDQFTARVNGPANNPILTASDRARLAGLEVNTTSASGQTLTVSYKDGAPSADVADYDKTWSSTSQVLANFGSTRIVSILVDNNITISSVTGGGVVGPRLLWIPGKYIYQITLPAEASTSGSPTSHLPVGVIQTTVPVGLSSNYKIDRDNVETNLLSQIDAHGTSTDISSLETKVNNLFPLTPDVAALINWANIYDPIHGAATVDITDGYRLIADHRSSTQRYESQGVTFGTGTNVITYTGLTDNLHRTFGFAIPQSNTVTLTGNSGTATINVNGTGYEVTFSTNLAVTASNFVTTHATALNTAGVTVTSSGAALNFVSTDPSITYTISDAVNATGNLAGTAAITPLTGKVLLWIVDGATNIPFIDITSAGVIRINSFTPAETTAQVVSNQVHFLRKDAGSPATVSQGSGNQRFTLPNFPTGSTDRSRTLQISLEIFVNGQDTLAGGFDPVVDIPATNTAEPLDTVVHDFNLGSTGNRRVRITTGYEFIVDGDDLDVRLTVVSAPSDVSVNYEGSTAAFLNYTAQTTRARIDNFQDHTVGTGSGDYTFTGQQEFILSMRPTIGGDGEQTGYLEAVPAAVGPDNIIRQLNDVLIRIPTPLWNSIQVADDIGFKTFVSDHYFVHSEVSGLLVHRRERWAYGLARLQTINSGHSITEAIDLAAGSTINGNPIGPGTVQPELVVFEADDKTTGPNGLVESVQLPANYATYKYVHITEYDSTSLQFRHAEFPTYILSAGLVDTNDNVRLQGNTVLGWTPGTRTLAMNPVAQEILRVTLKD